MNFECEYGFLNIVYEFWAWSICFSSSYGFKKFFWIFMNFYEQIEYKYLFFMAWLSAQLLKMIEK